MAIGNPVSLTSQVASKTISIIATASQTAFTVTGGYRINQLAVFRNGIRLVDSRDYEARDGATVTLLSAASEGDVVEFQVFDAFQVADTINPYSTYQTIDGNLNITGIVTAATFSVTDLDVRNITGVAATFTGQVTYEDVTNIDSIGIATFRDNVNIGVGGTTAFFDVGTGDVGIGTDNPLTKFHIFNGADGNAIAFISGEDTTSEFISLGVNAGEGVLTAGGSGSTSTDLILRTATSGTETERLRITSDGDVGIGTDNPVAKLNIFNGADDDLIVLIRGEDLSSEYMGLGIVGSEAWLTAGGSGSTSTDLIIRTANSGTETEKLRITSNGDVGIGSESPQNVFDVEGNEHTKLLVGTTGTGYATGLQITHAKGNAAEQKWQLQTDASSDGNLKIRNATSNTDHVFFDADNDETTFAGGVIVSGIATATQLYEGTTRVATSGKAIAMALIFG